MLGGLRGNLALAIVATTLALVSSILLLEEPLVEYRARAGARQNMSRLAQHVAERVTAGADPDAVADAVGARGGARIQVLSAEGRVLGDTALDGDELEKSGGSSGAPSKARIVATATTEQGLRVRASQPTTVVEATRDGVRQLVLIGGLLALVIAGLLTFVLSRLLVQPVRQLTRVADSLATGDLTVRTRAHRSDELGRLGRALDHMADQLAERLQTLRAEEARLRTVLDAMVEAVFVTDRRGRILMTNTALDRMVGTDARGRTAVEAVRSPELHEAVRGAREGQPASVELEVRIGGEPRSLSAQVAPLPDGAGVVAVLHDVTNLKRADRIRRDFVANASHELRTPLTAARGFAETLREGVDDPAAVQRFADMIVKHTLRLQRIVDDLLSLSRAEAPDGQVELEAVDVPEVVREVVQDLEPQAQESGLELTVGEMPEVPPIRTSRRALDHILVNLVDNALKYTPEGGRVRVTVQAEGSRVVLAVHDTGPGISPQHLERIFERFYRVDKGRSREMGGTGLGLSIVKHLAARIGADVDVDSEVGQGTTFRVSIQATDSDRVATAPSGPAEGPPDLEERT
jgi:two-component system phosphate regulon sensor histidine kinase PhoR